MSVTLFISYRRDDSKDVVGRMHGWLKMRLAPGTLFYDVMTVPAGTEYPTVIERVLSDDTVVLAIIGPSWVGTREEGKGRRIDQDDDMVRRELEMAFEHGKKVFPVLLNGAVMPARKDLPSSIATLADTQAISIRPDPDFEDDMRKLRAAMQQAAKDPDAHCPPLPWRNVQIDDPSRGIDNGPVGNSWPVDESNVGSTPSNAGRFRRLFRFPLGNRQM